jgi:hypothetical protein
VGRDGLSRVWWNDQGYTTGVEDEKGMINGAILSVEGTSQGKDRVWDQIQI